MIVLCSSMQGEDIWSLLMASVMCLHLSMQGKMFLIKVVENVTCVHVSQLVDHCARQACTVVHTH